MAGDRTTFDRMGYPGLVLAESFGSEPYLVEIGLVAPGQFGDRWAVVSHFGCDPDNPDAGTSSVEDYGDERAARKAYGAAVAEAAREALDASGLIRADRIPELSGDSVDDARAFFAEIGRMGATFHADDDPYDIVNGPSGRRLFDDGAAFRVAEAMKRFRTASAGWPDPGFLYSLAGQGVFDVERDYPGFTMDAGIEVCIGIGYPSLPGQEYPTIVGHEYGTFVAVQALPGNGTLSGSSAYRVMPVEGARFAKDGSVDLSDARLQHDEAREVASLDQIEDVACAVAVERPGTRPAA